MFERIEKQASEEDPNHPEFKGDSAPNIASKLFKKSGGEKFDDELISEFNKEENQGEHDTSNTELFNPDCSPIKHVTFVRNQRAGGACITNLLLQHAERERLIVALPLQDHWELGGFPAKIRSTLIDPQLPKYDVFVHPFRYERSQLQRFAKYDAKQITILRNPVAHVLSVFRTMGKFPYEVWLKEGETFGDFIEHPQKYYNNTTPGYYKAKNFQAYQLGFDSDADSDQAIIKAIQELDHTFSLVMITEFFDESLLLMREELCLKLDDLVHLKLNIRHRTEHEHESVEDDKWLHYHVSKLNRIDISLYDYFVQKLRVKIKNYGISRMERHVGLLREKIEERIDECIEKYVYDDGEVLARIVLKKSAPEICRRLIEDDVESANRFRSLQKVWFASRGRDVEHLEYDKAHDLLHSLQEKLFGEHHHMIHEDF